MIKGKKKIQGFFSDVSPVFSWKNEPKIKTNFLQGFIMEKSDIFCPYRCSQNTLKKYVVFIYIYDFLWEFQGVKIINLSDVSENMGQSIDQRLSQGSYAIILLCHKTPTIGCLLNTKRYNKPSYQERDLEMLVVPEAVFHWCCCPHDCPRTGPFCQNDH